MTDFNETKRLEISARLREARTLAGLSQGQVAKLIGLHRPSVSEIEAGNRRISADELVQLCDIYDVSTDWVLGNRPDSISAEDPKLELAARELSKLKPNDLERLLSLISAMRSESNRNDNEDGDAE